LDYLKLLEWGKREGFVLEIVLALVKARLMEKAEEYSG
jgi:hypothetical protein